MSTLAPIAGQRLGSFPNGSRVGSMALVMMKPSSLWVSLSVTSKPFTGPFTATLRCVELLNYYPKN